MAEDVGGETLLSYTHLEMKPYATNLATYLALRPYTTDPAARPYATNPAARPYANSLATVLKPRQYATGCDRRGSAHDTQTALTTHRQRQVCR